ncbi:MAG: hypothetical protein NTW87_13995 [Planctomycetota bacterium]|nr:hypothetical protein [Planctomycetota bacterium]
MTRIILALLFAASVACVAGGQEAKPPSGGREADAGTKGGWRVERSKDKDGKVTEVTRDERGNILIRTHNVGTPQEAIWLYTYSSTSQLMSEEAPDGTRALYDYETPDSQTPKRVKVISPDGKETIVTPKPPVVPPEDSRR